MFSSLVVLVALVHLLSLVEAACISTVHTQAASPTIITPSTTLITGQPTLRPRDANSICGLWSTWTTAWETSTIPCDAGVPCVFQSYQPGTVVGYCSSKDTQAKTEAFNNGLGPPNGCSPGQLCCNSANPEWGVYVFADSSSLTMCGSTRFWQTATATIAAVEAPSTTTTPSSASDNDSGSKLSTLQIVAIVLGGLGGIGSIAGGIVAVVRCCKNRRDDDDDNSGGRHRVTESNHVNHSGEIDSRHEFHFHAPVNLLLRDSPVHLYGGAGGLGSTLRIGNGTDASRSGSRLLLTGRR